MQTRPLVSIVIPSYNHGRYLAAAIESVLAQDYAALELIVIDDGSTDGSPQILEKFRGRFHWEVQANSGQAATLNRGWGMSRGEILAYLSADDLLLPAAISRSVAVLNDHPDAVLTYCDFNLIDPDSKVVRRVRTRDFDYAEMLTKMICHPGPGAFFRRRAFETAGGWRSEYRLYGDHELWLRLAQQGRFVRIPEVLAAFRVHPGSQTFWSPNASAKEPVRMVEAYFAAPGVPTQLQALKTQALSAAYLTSAQLHFRAGHYRAAFAAGAHGIRLYPRNLFAPRTLRMALNACFNRIAHRALWSVRAFFGS